MRNGRSPLVGLGLAVVLVLAAAPVPAAANEITGANYARGFNIDELYRLSPRLVYNTGKIRFAGEVELTAAYYFFLFLRSCKHSLRPGVYIPSCLVFAPLAGAVFMA